LYQSNIFPSSGYCSKHFGSRVAPSPCGGGLEYLHRSPCEWQEATEREHSLR
jgi:hypothetical protein